MTNNTDKPLKYFETRMTSYDSFESQWNQKIDGKEVSLGSFSDAHEGRYSEKFIVTLAPGERENIGGRLLTLKSPGEYLLSYSLTQNPALVKERYAKSKAIYQATQEISSFSVSADVSFSVKDVQTKAVEKTNTMSWEEWKAYSEQKVYDEKKYFSNLEQALKKPENAYMLSISLNGLTADMIKRIGTLINLKSLTLNGFEQETLPQEIVDLDLYELTINPKNGISLSFPNGISKNNSLRKLDVRFNGDFAPEILGLSNLEQLKVSSDNLDSQIDFGALKKLKKLDVGYSGLTSIANLGLKELKNLEELQIGGNKAIDNIDPIIHLTKLKILSSGNTSIKTLPEELGNLTELESLNLTLNRTLTTLPNSLAQLKNLQYLDVSRTGVGMLPEGTAKLPLEQVKVYDSPCKKTSDYKVLKKRLGDKFRD